MRRISPFHSGRNERGSTFLEVLVALAVLTALGMGAWHAVVVSLRLATRLHDRIAASSRALLLDDRVRVLAGRVRPPFWGSDHFVKGADGELVAPYLDGDPQKRLLLTFGNGVFTITTGQETTRYSGYRTAEMTTAVDEQGNHDGIALVLEESSGEHTTIFARFGATSLPSARQP